MSRSTQQGVCNALLVRYALGFLEVHVAPGAYGRVEGFLSLGQINDAPTAIATAQKVLAGLTGPQFATTVQLEPAGTADMPYSGFDLGDTVTDPGETSGTETTKVVGFTIGEDTEGKPTYVPSLSTISQLRELTAQNWLTRMSNGTLSGASSVASPAASLAIPGALLGPIGAVTPINLPPIPGGGIPGGGIPGGGISAVTSTDGTVVVTSPTGPTVDLSVPDVDTGGGGGGYLSLTGPGQTATPAALTQAGGFTISDAGGQGFSYSGTGGVNLVDNSSISGIALQEYGGSPILIENLASYVEVRSATGGILLLADSASNAGGITLSDTNTWSAMTGGLIHLVSTFSVQLQYDRVHVGSRGTAYVSIVDGQVNRTVHLYVNDRNPNGDITPQSAGDVCFDVGTPGIWLANGGAWTMYTNP